MMTAVNASYQAQAKNKKLLIMYSLQ